MRRKATLTHDRLVEEARMVLEKLQNTDVFGEEVEIAEAERVLGDAMSLGFRELLAFLAKYGYARIDAQAGTVTVTGGGRAALEARDPELDARLARHFARELTASSGRPRSEPTSPLLGGLDGTQTAIVRTRRPLGSELPSAQEEVLDRRYRRAGLLGRGTLGTVHRASHVGLGRTLAIKEVSTVFQFASYLRRDEILGRLEASISAQARLGHPNIIQIFDQNVEREHPYFAMELAEGGNLRQRLDAADDGRLPLQTAVRILLQLAHALRDAHAHGLLHLGLKPENVLFDRLGNVKLTDFGLSRVVEQAPGQGAPAPILIGPNAVGYFAPERIQPGATGDLTAAADIYSLGILFYEMISGKLPGRRSPLPSKAVEGVPEAFDEVFDAMTHDELSERHASMSEVLSGIYSSFPPEMVHAEGTILAWATDPGPVPELESESGIEIEPLGLEEPVPSRITEPTPSPLASARPSAPPRSVAPVPSAVPSPVPTVSTAPRSSSAATPPPARRPPPPPREG